MKFHLKNKDGNIIINQFTLECKSCIKSTTLKSNKVICSIHKDKRIIGFYENEIGSCFACSNDELLYNKPKIFRKKVQFANDSMYAVENIKKELKEGAERLTHNLTKTNAHNIQELYALVPQDILSKNYKNQLEIISEIIMEDPIEAAKTFLRIAKNNAAIKVEFSVFNKMFSGNSSLNIKPYHIKNVTLNVFHIFFNNFNKINVYVDVQDCEDTIRIDYESIHVILYHLIDNATKYILPDTTLYVTFVKNENDYRIRLDMISVKIEEEEKTKILSDRVRGVYAKKLNKTGSGIGLSQISKILDVIGGDLIIYNNPNEEKSVKYKSVKFENNIFEIILNN